MDNGATGELFDERYYAVGCGAKYERNEEWLAFFGGIAERILADIGPRTVMDAGCALGLLVESLRTRGVAAFGRDISQFAIEHVHPSIYPYCELGSITAPFGQHYDLIVSIEVLEHLPPEEARRAVANLCQHTDDILFSSSPFDYKEVTHFNVQPPEYWAELFAQQGFYRDVDFDAGFITEWAVRFRRSHEPLHRLVRDYERAYWLLRTENRDLRSLALEQRAAAQKIQATPASEPTRQAERPLGLLAQALQTATHELAEQDRELQALRAKSSQSQQALQSSVDRWAALESSPGYAVLRSFQRLRRRMAPPLSSRDRLLDSAWQVIRLHNREAWRIYGGRARYEISQQFRRGGARAGAAMVTSGSFGRRAVTPASDDAATQTQLVVDAVPRYPPVGAHQATVDVVICVHNALDDVRRCLESVVQWTRPPYRLIIIDDGSAGPTQAFLDDFAGIDGVTLVRNTAAKGYTRAANQGLESTSSDFVVLLNSDTVVGPEWLDRLVACAATDPGIGIAGPLSNAATWQSVPNIADGDDWAANPLPADVTVADMGVGVARHSARLYPRVPFLNGFCLLIRRQVLDAVGYFDEDQFGAGYGEENDYCLRATAAGWTLAIADDVYVYHAGSKSYSDERRRQLCDRANLALKRKHGEQKVNERVEFMANSRVLEGIRAHAAVVPEQEALIRQARARFGGSKVLWLLPIMTPGGGGAVVVTKAKIMAEMGITVALFNLNEYQSAFEQIYLGLDVLRVYGRPEDVGPVGSQYDAVIATANVSAYWLLPLVTQSPHTTLGYFIQDFEPYFYKPDSSEHRLAWGSYSVVPAMQRFATTEWIQNEVTHNTGMPCGLVGPCYNSGLFRPRPRTLPEWPDRPLRVGAMIRPATAYRAPKLTMEVLAAIDRKYGSQVEIRLFGCGVLDPAFQALPHDFRWRHAGQLNQPQVAAFLNEVDIFTDFSTFQALGITAQEAMSCGAAVIVPEAGGTGVFARHGHNCLVVDSGSATECIAALSRMIEDHELRTRLQANAIQEVCAYHPHLPTYRILETLFGGS